MPYGFEPLGIYYNRSLVEKVPTLWSTLDDILKKPTEETDMPSPEDNNFLTIALSKKNAAAAQPAFINLGYGAATPASADILVLMAAQKK